LNCALFHSYFTVERDSGYGATEFHKWPYRMLIDKVIVDCESKTVDFLQAITMYEKDVILCEIGYVRTIVCNITLNS